MRHVIEPLLQQLARDSGETASFYVRQGPMRVVLHRVEPARAVRFSVREGEQFPLDRGASGHVLVAFTRPANRPEKTQERAARERMWAVSYGERDPDSASAAVPVFGISDEVQGALALSGPRDRIASPEAMREACRMLLAAAQQASAALGGDPARFARSLEQIGSEPLGETAVTR